jgi:hypothetical protein
MVMRHIDWQELEGDVPVESRILGFVHHAHSARAKLLDNAVVGDGASSAQRQNQAHQILSARWNVGSRKMKSLPEGLPIIPNAIALAPLPVCSSALHRSAFVFRN